MEQKGLDFILGLEQGDNLNEAVNAIIFRSVGYYHRVNVHLRAYNFSSNIDSAWLVQQKMRELGYRFSLTRSHHRPKGLPQWRASFCRYGQNSNRWFDDNECVAICKAAIIAIYNKERPGDRYIQTLPREYAGRFDE